MWWKYNPISYCPYSFNHSQFEWEQIQAHLDGKLGNNSLDSSQLENKVEEPFKQELHQTDLENLAQLLCDTFSLDPKVWMQSMIHSASMSELVFIILFIVFFLGFVCLN